MTKFRTLHRDNAISLRPVIVNSRCWSIVTQYS